MKTNDDMAILPSGQLSILAMIIIEDYLDNEGSFIEMISSSLRYDSYVYFLYISIGLA